MSGKGGRPRTFPLAIVPVALELREREGRTWPEIARELGVHPGTLRTRAAEYRRMGLALNHAGARSGPGTGPSTSEGSNA